MNSIRHKTLAFCGAAALALIAVAKAGVFVFGPAVSAPPSVRPPAPPTVQGKTIDKTAAKDREAAANQPEGRIVPIAGKENKTAIRLPVLNVSLSDTILRSRAVAKAPTVTSAGGKPPVSPQDGAAAAAAQNSAEPPAPSSNADSSISNEEKITLGQAVGGFWQLVWEKSWPFVRDISTRFWGLLKEAAVFVAQALQKGPQRGNANS